MQNLARRYRGERVEVVDRYGRVYRGVMVGDPPPGGISIRTGFRTRFIARSSIRAVFVARFRFRLRIF